ncbi:MAG: diacylglycerol kinase family lipid kinase [Oscillospiraceae bacterium]|nr:diacylglycerol kinase family lipid kinase [Oscillospiraceae bacterium]
MTKKLLLIINPNAGKMKANSTLLELVSAFSSKKYEVTVYPTEKKSDAEKKVVKCGKDYDLIVCYGGDGTLSEIVNGIARIDEPPIFSFVPSGTANDFAATVAMPSDISLAVKKIVGGKNHPLDIGKFCHKNQSCKYFVYVAAFGLFTSVSYTVPQDIKKAFGHLSYVAEGIKQVIDVPSYKMTVEWGDKVIKDEFVVGLVTNTTSVAGMFKLDKSKVKLDDGEFEILLVRNPGNPILLSKIIVDLSAQKFDPNYVIFERVSKVKFRCDESVAWCLDGENGGIHKNITIENLHRKGTIRV